MMLLWSFKAKKGRQLFWRAFCVLSLLENLVVADEPTTGSTTTINTTTISTATISTTTVNTTSSKLPTATSRTTGPTLTTTTSTGKAFQSTKAATNTTKEIQESDSENKINATSSPTLSMKTTSEAIKANSSTESSIPQNVTAQGTTAMTRQTSASTEQPKYTSTDLHHSTVKADNNDVMTNIECVNIKNVNGPEVISLELDETSSCSDFKKLKGLELSKVICEQFPCNITLAESDVKPNSILLVEVINKEKQTTDMLHKILQKQTTSLDKLGIKSHKQEGIGNHQDYSRKTLIALVTSGLLLAFLGSAGYFLMKQRSWSPMGERLGEDPHYTENGSHCNTVISVASHEQSDLRDKPNLNGGARENGTGQPTSKNGHSTRAHVVADTEL